MEIWLIPETCSFYHHLSTLETLMVELMGKIIEMSVIPDIYSFSHHLSPLSKPWRVSKTEIWLIPDIYPFCRHPLHLLEPWWVKRTEISSSKTYVHSVITSCILRNLEELIKVKCRSSQRYVHSLIISRIFKNLDESLLILCQLPLVCPLHAAVQAHQHLHEHSQNTAITERTIHTNQWPCLSRLNDLAMQIWRTQIWNRVDWRRSEKKIQNTREVKENAF